MTVRGMHGVLVVDKPPGMSSAAVVGKVKRRLHLKKVGHTGTLDPMATGVLPLCIGEGTKIAGYLLADDKAYEGELLLGQRTDTLDREGQVVEERLEAAAQVSEADLRAAAESFIGDIEQVPPMYSAIKHQGKRLHELARAGLDVERKARSVRIHSFEILSFDEGRARFRVHCSKGTYVRTLVDDLGQHLGCGAHLTELRRIQSGVFDLSTAVDLDELQPDIRHLELVRPEEALPHLPRVAAPQERVADVRNGKPLQWQVFSDSEPPAGPVLLMHPNGALLAIVELDSDRLRYRRVFTYGLTNGE